MTSRIRYKLYISITLLLLAAAGAWYWHKVRAIEKGINAAPILSRNADPDAPCAKKKVEDIKAIKKFTGQQDLQIIYTGTRPATEPFYQRTAGGASPVRKVNVYQQRNFANNSCQVLEYEIDSRNNDIIEVHAAAPARNDTCQKVPDEPTDEPGQIQAAALGYLKKNKAMYERIKDSLSYEEHAVGSPAESTYSWEWQDTGFRMEYALNASASSNYPTVKITLDGSGRLVYFLDSINLFQ